MLKVCAVGAASYTFLGTAWYEASPSEIAIMLSGLVVPMWLMQQLVRIGGCALQAEKARRSVGKGL